MITIDTTVWMRPTMYGEKKGLTPQQVTNRIKKGELTTWYVKELRLMLVRENAT